MTAIYEKINLIAYRDGKLQNVDDLIAKEKQIRVFINDAELTTLLCSPGDYKVLVTGFLLNQGLLHDPAEIKEFTYNSWESAINVKTHTPAKPGIHGQEIRPVQSHRCFKAIHLLKMMAAMEEGSETFRLTGGVHSAGLANDESLLHKYEDIGRHNAVDKLLGHLFLKRIPTDDKCLLLSGRIQSDILKKAARSKIPVIVSRSAPSSLAIKLGTRLGVTVVGFARASRLSIYCNPEKIVI